MFYPKRESTEERSRGAEKGPSLVERFEEGIPGEC